MDAHLNFAGRCAEVPKHRLAAFTHSSNKKQKYATDAQSTLKGGMGCISKGRKRKGALGAGGPAIERPWYPRKFDE